MATVSVNALVQTLRQYQLLKPAELAELTDSLQSSFADPQALAKELCRRGWLTPFQARQFLVGKGGNLIVGPYLLLDILGAGGRGQVFKARHRTMGRLVALKMLHKDLLADDEAVQRFFREVEVISQLAHPAIVHAYDADAVGSSYYLAMEFVDGVDLERLVKDSGKLAPHQACDYIRQAALGLQYAHERGLVHRDIKPSNLLVESKESRAESQQSGSRLSTLRSGQIKILDLGLARLQQPAAGSRTQQLTVLAGNQSLQGTPDYLAPEQALDFHNADIRSDIYSLGCTLFYVLTGQPPFPGGTLPQKLMKHQMAEPPALESTRGDLPPALPGIVRKMLAKKQEERYQTPGEVAEALAGCLGPTVAIAAARRPPSPVTLHSESTMEMIAPPSTVLKAPAAARTTRTTGVALPGTFRDRWPLIAGGGGALFLLLLSCLGALMFFTGGGSREPVAETTPAPPVITRADKPSLLLDGKTTVIPLPDGLIHKSKTLTIEAWFKTKAGGTILGYQKGPYPTGGGGHVPLLYVGTDGLLRGEVWYDAAAPITSKVRVNDDVWHHACLVVDGPARVQRFYLDGALVGTQSGNINHLDMVNNQLGVGHSAGWPAGAPWYHYTGALAEVRIWHRALSAEEVQQHRGRSLTGKEPGLVLYLPLDEATGTEFLDRSAAGLKLKLFKDAKVERLPGGPPVK